MVAAPPFHWTRERFLAATDAGAFGDVSVELLEGEVYEVVSENWPHRYATMLLLKALSEVYGPEFIVRSEMGLPLGRSQPKPDISVLRWDRESFRTRDEGIEDVVLLVEVVDTRADTAEQKRGFYARARVPEYWILDVNERTLKILRTPLDGTYREEIHLTPDGDVPGDALRTRSIAVADVLP